MNDLRDQTQVGGAVRSNASIFMQHVYTWMAAGLGVTAVATYVTMSSPALLSLLFGQSIVPFIVLWVGLLGMVFYLSSSIHKLSAGAATGMFLLYATLMGTAIAPSVYIAAQVSPGAVTQAFVTTAGMFGAMSLFGAVTKRDLTGMGSFMFMGLIGIIIASIVNLFVGSSAVNFAISVLGVIIFAGLTAYDTQKLRAMGESAPLDDATAIRRGAILGALSLYLDVINLFLMLLRLFSGRD